MGREEEREGEKHQCVVASHVPPTGDLARNPGMCPDWESNRQPFGLQASTQSTEPYQPGQNPCFYICDHPQLTCHILSITKSVEYALLTLKVIPVLPQPLPHHFSPDTCCNSKESPHVFACLPSFCSPLCNQSKILKLQK